MPGGALAVPEGDAILPVVRQLNERHSLVVATQDWHPREHGSFGLWIEKKLVLSLGEESTKVTAPIGKALSLPPGAKVARSSSEGRCSLR